MNITIIGNNARNGAVSDGGRIKIRLYKNLLEKERHSVNIIDLDGWKKRFFSIVLQIKKAIKREDRIIIMAGPKGCRRIIPIVSHFNKKKKSKVVFCTLGVGALDDVIKDLKPDEAQAFLSCKYEINKQDEKMAKKLKQLEYVVVENDALAARYKTFYNLDNVIVLENFRNYDITNKKYDNTPNKLKIIYASRIKGYKGILDLMQAVNELIKDNQNISLDIYGEYQLNDTESDVFNRIIRDCDGKINCYGVISSDKMIDTLKQYDLFCLPTKYHGEGTPGSLIESLISGTPALVSAYSQSKELINDGFDGFLYKFGSFDELKMKIKWILDNKSCLSTIGKAAQLKAIKFTYFGNKETFLKVMAGD